MKKLFGQFVFAAILFVFYFGSALAQPVLYSIEDGNGQFIGRVVFDYRPNGGYTARMKGEKIAVEITENAAIATMGKLVITMPLNGPYYHTNVGRWRVLPVTTSFGDSGESRLFYAGLTPYGRLYREELWLNGRLFNHSETVVDHHDRIVWSVGTDAEGTLRLSRL